MTNGLLFSTQRTGLCSSKNGKFHWPEYYLITECKFVKFEKKEREIKEIKKLIFLIKNFEKQQKKYNISN